MSRSDSTSPSSKTSSLPRRRFLQAMTAALPAAVALPSPGQAFSSPLAAAVAADPRFARVDRLMAKIVDAEARWHGVSESKSPRLWGKLNEKWYDAREALEEFETETARNPLDPVLDAALFAKIANFWDSVDEGNLSEEYGALSEYPSFRRTIEALLRAANIKPFNASQGGANV